MKHHIGKVNFRQRLMMTQFGRLRSEPLSAQKAGGRYNTVIAQVS